MARLIRRFWLFTATALLVAVPSFASLPTATLTVSGAETQPANQSWDIGPLQILINVYNFQVRETIFYGQYSTPASVASTIAGLFSRDYLQNGLCASASGNIVTFKLRTAGATFGTIQISGPSTSYQLNPSGFASYNWTPSGGTTGLVYMTGGQDAGTYYDSGTVTVHVGGTVASADWNEGSTPSTVASELASAINTAAAGLVNASPSGAVVNVTSLMTGPGGDMTLSSNVADTSQQYFTNSSFSVTTQNMTGGGTTESSLLYGFTVPDGGYAANGNLLSAYDSVMGQWNYGYDNLNRLTNGSATAEGIQADYTNATSNWTYDAFGNRTGESWGSSGNYSGNSVPANTGATFTSANQMNGTQFTYDAAGDVTWDGLNNYLYDAEGRLCAVKNYFGEMTGYIYDASGIRVAKGNLSSFSCNFAPSNFTTTTSWVLGPGGEQVTEYSVSGGTSTWVHTNAYASGALLATYHDTDTYFALEDWLGTKRAEASAGGCYSTFTTMPYGDGLTANGNCVDATEHHFTGKERDTESGNDYFEARYYAARWAGSCRPTGAPKEEPVPYAKLDDPQTLNLYSYVQNNPLTRADANGHVAIADDVVIGIAVAAILTVAVVEAYNHTPEGQRNIQNISNQAGENFTNNMHAVKEKVTSVFSFKKTVKTGAADNAGHTCEYCGTGTVPAKKSASGVTPPANEQQTDHYHPKAGGGTDDPGNAVNACRGCNREKSDTAPEGTKWELPRMKPPPPPPPSEPPPHN